MISVAKERVEELENGVGIIVTGVTGASAIPRLHRNN